MKQYTLQTLEDSEPFDADQLHFAQAVIKCSDEYGTTVVLKLCTGQKVTIYVTPDYRTEPAVYVNLYNAEEE